jgi:hypothetical protein
LTPAGFPRAIPPGNAYRWGKSHAGVPISEHDRRGPNHDGNRRCAAGKIDQQLGETSAKSAPVDVAAMDAPPAEKQIGLPTLAAIYLSHEYFRSVHNLAPAKKVARRVPV